jgi:hypothetical protein
MIKLFILIDININICNKSRQRFVDIIVRLVRIEMILTISTGFILSLLQVLEILLQSTKISHWISLPNHIMRPFTYLVLLLHTASPCRCYQSLHLLRWYNLIFHRFYKQNGMFNRYDSLLRRPEITM